jgi:hypothetical protein
VGQRCRAHGNTRVDRSDRGSGSHSVLDRHHPLRCFEGDRGFSSAPLESKQEVFPNPFSAEPRDPAPEPMRLVDGLDGEQRVKLLAAFCWANSTSTRRISARRMVLWE